MIPSGSGNAAQTGATFEKLYRFPQGPLFLFKGGVPGMNIRERSESRGSFRYVSRSIYFNVSCSIFETDSDRQMVFQHFFLSAQTMRQAMAVARCRTVTRDRERTPQQFSRKETRLQRGMFFRSPRKSRRYTAFRLRVIASSGDK